MDLGVQDTGAIASGADHPARAADWATADIAGRALATAEPLIVAAAAVAAGEPQTAETALAQIGDESVGANPDSKTYRLTEAIIKMTIARARTDADNGLHWFDECRRLLAELSAQQQHVAAPELAAMLAAHEGAFLMEEIWLGPLWRWSRWTPLALGARRKRSPPPSASGCWRGSRRCAAT